MNDSMTGTAIAAYPNEEENTLLIVNYSYRVIPVYEKKRYHYKVQQINADNAFLVTEDNVFFYEVEDNKAKKTTCSEINSSFQSLKNTYRYNYDHECFVGGNKHFMNLIEKVQEIVYDKTNKRLECEVKIIQ